MPRRLRDGFVAAMWRNLSEGTPVRVRVRGLELEGYGEVVRGDSSLAARYIERFPRARTAIDETNEPIFVRVHELRLSSSPGPRPGRFWAATR